MPAVLPPLRGPLPVPAKRGNAAGTFITQSRCRGLSPLAARAVGPRIDTPSSARDFSLDLKLPPVQPGAHVSCLTADGNAQLSAAMAGWAQFAESEPAAGDAPASSGKPNASRLRDWDESLRTVAETLRELCDAQQLPFDVGSQTRRRPSAGTRPPVHSPPAAVPTPAKGTPAATVQQRLAALREDPAALEEFRSRVGQLQQELTRNVRWNKVEHNRVANSPSVRRSIAEDRSKRREVAVRRRLQALERRVQRDEEIALRTDPTAQAAHRERLAATRRTMELAFIAAFAARASALQSRMKHVREILRKPRVRMCATKIQNVWRKYAVQRALEPPTMTREQARARIGEWLMPIMLKRRAQRRPRYVSRIVTFLRSYKECLLVPLLLRHFINTTLLLQRKVRGAIQVRKAREELLSLQWDAVHTELADQWNMQLVKEKMLLERHGVMEDGRRHRRRSIRSDGPPRAAPDDRLRKYLELRSQADLHARLPAHYKAAAVARLAKRKRTRMVQVALQCMRAREQWLVRKAFYERSRRSFQRGARLLVYGNRRPGRPPSTGPPSGRSVESASINPERSVPASPLPCELEPLPALEGMSPGQSGLSPAKSPGGLSPGPAKGGLSPGPAKGGLSPGPAKDLGGPRRREASPGRHALLKPAAPSKRPDVDLTEDPSAALIAPQAPFEERWPRPTLQHVPVLVKDEMRTCIRACTDEWVRHLAASGEELPQRQARAPSWFNEDAQQQQQQQQHGHTKPNHARRGTVGTDKGRPQKKVRQSGR
eukprot:TRINITY_DN7158_c0_g2_i2.p1 TRINITY_DN7158_c0_g2~~TRINITY_DN7158_c0_g2_i2.p1  ORF type:complete len:811 (+),score=283.95 TRINITY_DN7158_c0_g2_i2:119-2434(+)